MFKALLQALLFVVLLECMNAGVPNFYRRQEVPIADNDGDYIDSDDFLANFLENIPEILDEPENRNSVRTTKKDPGDTAQYEEPIHKHHDINDVKKNLPYNNINQAPTIVPDSGTVSQKAPAELKARSDIVTGVSAVATVVSGAMAQFMSFLARKKLMIAAVGAAVLGTFGISHVVTDDLIGFAENITGVRFQRQFEESNQVSPMRQLIGDVVSWFSDSNKSESVDSSNIIEERTDTVIVEPVNPRNSLTSNEDVSSNKDDIAALSSLISINSTNDDTKEIKFKEVEVEVNKQALEFDLLSHISSKSNIPAAVDNGESKIAKSHKNVEVNVVSEVNDSEQFETSESTPSPHFSPLKEASDSTFKTNFNYEESQSVSDNTVQSSVLSEGRVIDDFFIEEDPFMVTVLSPEYSKFSDTLKSQEDILAPLSEVEYNSDSSKGNETLAVGDVESKDVDSSMHSLSGSLKFPTPLSQTLAKSPSSTFENNTHIGDQGITQKESNLVNQVHKVSGFEKNDTNVKRLNTSDELLDDDISVLGVDVEVIVDEVFSKDKNKTEVLDLVKIDDKANEENSRMVEGKVATYSESRKLNGESNLEAVIHHNTINEDLHKPLKINKIEPLSIEDAMIPGFSNIETVSESLSGENTVGVDDNVDPLFDGNSLLHKSDQISRPIVKESYSSSKSEEIKVKSSDQDKEVKTTTELYTDIFETIELELELFPSADEVLKGHQPTVFVNEEIADDKKLRL